MKKTIKKTLQRITVINLVGMLLFSQLVFAENESANVSYNDKNKTVTVIANAAGYEGAAAIITISGATDAANTIMNIARTDASGVVTHNEVMPEGFGGDRYNVTVATKEKTLTGYFLYPDTALMNSVLPIINGKTTYSDLCQALKDNANSLAIDMLVFGSIAEDVSKIMFAQKPEGGWSTSTEFLKSYNNALAAVSLNSGTDPAEVFSKYGAAFEFDAGKYTALETAEKALLDVYLKNADYTLLSVTDAFLEGKAVSQLLASESWNAIQKKIEDPENAATLKFDTVYFDKLVNKDAAYQDFFSGVTGNEDIQALRKLFSAVTENCYNLEQAPVFQPSSKNNVGSVRVPTGTVEAPTVSENTGNNSAFTDMAGHWAEDAVNSLTKRGIIGGFPDGSFKPDESVTRAQFVVMVAKALGLSSSEACSLIDVQKGSWYEESVSAAAEAGIIFGMDGEMFYPDRNISRQDAFLILYRAFGDRLQKISEKTFIDSETISDYAKEAVAALGAAGIANGTDTGEIKPLDNTKRAEIAAILARVLEAGKE